MRRLPLAVFRHGVQVGLPTVVEELLVDVAIGGFTLSCCRPKTAPTALAAIYEWNCYVDLLTIRDVDRVTTAQVPTREEWTSSPPRSIRRQQACTFPKRSTPDDDPTPSPRRAGYRLPGVVTAMTTPAVIVAVSAAVPVGTQDPRLAAG